MYNNNYYSYREFVYLENSDLLYYDNVKKKYTTGIDFLPIFIPAIYMYYRFLYVHFYNVVRPNVNIIIIVYMTIMSDRQLAAFWPDIRAHDTQQGHLAAHPCHTTIVLPPLIWLY